MDSFGIATRGGRRMARPTEEIRSPAQRLQGRVGGGANRHRGELLTLKHQLESEATCSDTRPTPRQCAT